MGVLSSVLQWIKRRKITMLMLIVTFVVSGLLVNLLQLFTLPLYWINRRIFRLVNARIVYLHWCSKPLALSAIASGLFIGVVFCSYAVDSGVLG